MIKQHSIKKHMHTVEIAAFGLNNYVIFIGSMKSRINEGFYSLYPLGIHHTYCDIEGIKYFHYYHSFLQNCSSSSGNTTHNSKQLVRHGSLFASPLG